jgi:hypothetical protein
MYILDHAVDSSLHKQSLENRAGMISQRKRKQKWGTKDFLLLLSTSEKKTVLQVYKAPHMFLYLNKHFTSIYRDMKHQLLGKPQPHLRGRRNEL